MVLVCVVTGFYPREISVNWERNGETISENVLSTDILPNHDFTYQVQKSVDIPMMTNANTLAACGTAASQRPCVFTGVRGIEPPLLSI